MKFYATGFLVCSVVLVISFVSSSEAVTEFVCEFSHKTLSCPSDKVIEVKFANYGRIGHNVCYRGGYRTATDRINNCYDESHTEMIALLCNGRNSCPVYASNDLFGDTCPGVFKYLQVKYGCV